MRQVAEVSIGRTLIVQHVRQLSQSSSHSPQRKSTKSACQTADRLPHDIRHLPQLLDHPGYPPPPAAPPGTSTAKRLERFEITAVSAENLVAPVSRQGHRHLFPRQST